MITVLTCAMALLAPPARPTTVVVFDARSLNWEERCTVESLQGLVNRSGPRLYLDNGDPWDQHWLDVYAQRAGFRYQRIASLPELIRRFHDVARGLVVYDPAVDGTRYAAVTMAGIDDLLPVSPEMLAGTSPAWGGAQPTIEALGLPVKYDLRGRFRTSLEACEWALRDLMPRTCCWLAHAVDGGKADGILTGVCGPMSGFDWQVMNRGFVFNLGASAKRVDAYGAQVGGSPDQTALYARILDAMTPPAMVDGFGDPEDVWCSLLSRHNAFSFHAYRNWSFHSRVPAPAPPFKQRVSFTQENTKPDTSRYYVCFMTSEGDTMKGPIPFFYGSWFDPARGKVPINWGINPLMARFFPAMLRYYYDTATPSDYFFAGCSGAGYCYPDIVPQLGKFTRHTAAACDLAGIREIDMWGGNLPSTQAAYARDAAPLGLSVLSSPARLKFLPDGTPVAFDELGYWQTQGLDGKPWPTVFEDPAKRREAVRRLVDHIDRIATRMRPPFIILVYGDLHNYDRHATLYKEVADALDPKRFKVARLDEAFSALRAWARDRVMVGAESINEPLVLAALSGTTTTLPVTLTNGAAMAAGVRVTISAATGQPLLAGRATQSHPEVRNPKAIATGAPRNDKGRESPPSTPRSCKVTLAAHEVRLVPLLKLKPGEARPAAVALDVRALGHSEHLTGELDAIPGGDPDQPVTFSAMWYAETLNHPAGKAIDNPDGLLGRVWSSPDPSGRTECIVCGPYAVRPAGRYIAAFRVRFLPTPNVRLAATAKVLTLEMSSGGYSGTGAVLADKTFIVRDLPPGGGWKWLLLDGDWPGPPNQMELRVQWHGSVPVLVDRVALFRIDTPPAGGKRSVRP